MRQNKWLKATILRWLSLGTVNDDIKQLREENKALKEELRLNEAKYKLLDEKHKNFVYSTQQTYMAADKRIDEVEITLKSIVKVGVDYNKAYITHQDYSWAVVCIEGKQDFVQFYTLGRPEAQEIQRFLRQFSKANKTQDLPFGMKKFDI